MENIVFFKDNIEIFNGISAGKSICSEIEKAKEEIIIMSPYIGGSYNQKNNLYDSLGMAMNKGVKVKIFTLYNFKNTLDKIESDKDRKLDNFIKFLSLFVHKKNHENLEIEIINEEKYNFDVLKSNQKYNFFHSKIILIDNKILFLGSINFTSQAFNNNIETRIKIKTNDNYKDVLEGFNNYYNNINKAYEEYFYDKTEILNYIENIIKVSEQSFVYKKSKIQEENENLKKENYILKTKIEKLEKENESFNNKIRELKKSNLKFKIGIKILFIITIFILFLMNYMYLYKNII